MLNTLFFWRDKAHPPDPLSDNRSPVPAGYFAPASVEELLGTPLRQQYLQTLWDYSSLPRNLYQQYYLTPLEQCVLLMQQFPVAEQGAYAYPGGMVDCFLKTLANAVKLSKSYMLPPGADPEDQATQGAAWSAVIVWATMFSVLDNLAHLHVEQENGQVWSPVAGVLDKPYRFRFVPETQPEKVYGHSAMLAFRLLPEEGLRWLIRWPDALKALSMFLAGYRAQSGVVGAIVLQAGEGSDKTPPVTPSALPEACPDSAFDDYATFLQQAPPPCEYVENIPDDLPSFMENVEGADLSSEPALCRFHPAGELFIDWLRQSIQQKKTIANEPDGHVYVIAGAVFLKTPSIFHRFMAEQREALRPLKIDNWRDVQRQFEKINLHRRQRGGANVYQCRNRESQKVYHGYLVPAKEIYGAATVPADTPLLEVSSLN
ncbi:TraI domain-containing protein [Klebsiella pneumoniae]|uniref:TraI domain-containing protein n=1 Tax=Klebsiella pneumoniae TaxID=573 RepID=UPI00359DB35C